MITKTESKSRNLRARTKVIAAQESLAQALRLLEDYPNLAETAEWHLANAITDATKALKQIKKLIKAESESN